MSHRGKDKSAPVAVALHYDGSEAPEVTASGQRLLAEEILAIAESHGVPIHKDPDLVRFLARLEVGERIPRELYVAVAEVIAFAYWLSGRMPPASDEPENQGRSP
ncbi:EscU/YscU/HrcU family type III secretion system export apparatus switch protein [Natronospira bacteriovora]|uniref:Flagellar biosynthetic protein FlhB n=1 Tax=Natronospira bacteriovora TaxID=3069753 RepID=A0ABU0W374_9GAMM|nr:EscU/YscU/HrcU family type III secretion system export apparatus switch protein [Natronospira sp. AB-CW4]MDQ2068446.1 EscU/YscU/HrcU family type III secretion system export apparatus switch protein [Natronospira sp. AB-CW4]